MAKPEILDRLLSSKEPAIRWKVRVRVLGESPTSAAIRRLQREIRDSLRVRRLLSGREGSGRITRPSPEVYAKWFGAHWVMAALADTGYPRGDRALLPIRDQLMERWLADRYFAEFEATTRSQVYRREGVPLMQGRHRRCASQQGNALFSVVSLGLADRRAEDLIERLLHWQWPDGGWNCDKRPDASRSSFMESLIPLRALSLVARETGRPDAEDAARRAAEIFLERHLFRRRSDGAVMRSGFLELHYPLYWHYDFLAGLVVMAEAGLVHDPRCREALDTLEAKRLRDGGWPAEKRFFRMSTPPQAGTELFDWGPASKRRTNEWVTADALYVLRAAGRPID